MPINRNIISSLYEKLENIYIKTSTMNLLLRFVLMTYFQ
nr:MAG TPA: hypothetical protein [Caudoviricetes sp.]